MLIKIPREVHGYIERLLQRESETDNQPHFCYHIILLGKFLRCGTTRIQMFLYVL